MTEKSRVRVESRLRAAGVVNVQFLELQGWRAEGLGVV